MNYIHSMMVKEFILVRRAPVVTSCTSLAVVLVLSILRLLQITLLPSDAVMVDLDGVRVKFAGSISATLVISFDRSSCLWQSGIALYSHPMMNMVSFSHLEFIRNVLFWMRYDHKGLYCFRLYSIFQVRIVKIPESVFFFQSHSGIF